MWNFLQDYATKPWVGFAFGIIVLILGWKMRATWANKFLVVAWLIFTISAYRTSLLSGQSVLPRVLWVALGGATLGLLIYYTLWTRVEKAALGPGPSWGFHPLGFEDLGIEPGGQPRLTTLTRNVRDTTLVNLEE